MTTTISVETLFDNQVHIGHKKDSWNPKMRDYIFSQVNNIHIFDLEKTMKAMEEAKKIFLATRIKNGKILFVGTKPQISFVINKKLSDKKHFFVNEKWCPGLLTNFNEVRKRIDHYLKLKEQFESGEINKYTKKEVVKFKKELKKLESLYQGVAEMRKTPQLIVILDSVGNRLAIEEANKKNIPVIAIVDSNADPDGIDFVIPSNDDSVKSVGFLLENMLQWSEAKN